MSKTLNISSRRPQVILIATSIVVLGFIGTLFVSHEPFMHRSVISRAKWDLATLDAALEAYYADHGAYPGQRPLREFSKRPEELKVAGGWDLMTVEPGLGDKLHGLTTPVAYLKEIPEDPFTATPSTKWPLMWLFGSTLPDSFYYFKSTKSYSPYAYYTDGKGWILYSACPGTVYEINPASDYDSSKTQPVESLLVKTFDPTNGSSHLGGVWRISKRR